MAGTPWNDGSSYSGVPGIKLSYSTDTQEGAIGLFLATYDKDGNSITGPAHGTIPSNFQITEIGLDFPRHYITKVSGYIGRSTLLPDNDAVRSLKFETNRGTVIGPFGVENGQPFELAIRPNERIVGFSGVSGLLVNSIDIYTRIV